MLCLKTVFCQFKCLLKMEDVFHHCNTFSRHSSDSVAETNQSGEEKLPRDCCFTWLNTVKRNSRDRSLFMLLRENTKDDSKRMHPLWLLDLHHCLYKGFLIYGTPLSFLYYNICY